MSEDPPRKTRQLVLVGGGHSHVAVLRAFGMSPLPEARIVLISNHWDTPYSGMLPALIAGHYSRDEIHVDLHRLCRYAGADFCRDRMIGLDLKARTVQLANRPPVHFDILSINTGSTPKLDDVPGAAEHALPVKPIDNLLAGLEALEKRIAAHGTTPFRIVTVGGGAGGVELTLSLHHRFLQLIQQGKLKATPPEFEIITATPGLLASHNAGVRRRLNKALARRGVKVRLNARVRAVTRGEAHCENGGTVAFDALLWATHAAAPEWPRAAGINVTDSGFIAVNRFLQSTSHDFIYAAGDVAEMIGNPRPKNGVFAVRQGRPLAQNLRLALSGFHPRPYRPQRSFLSLISTGNRNAIASKGPWAAAGGWVWHWKQRIDRKWMHQYRELPKMEISQAEMDFTARMKKNLKTTDHKGREEKPRMRCGGCGAKVGGLILHEALRQLKQPANPAVVVGLAAPDDAAVLTVPAGRPLVQSVDFFPSLINDPHLFGRIAANHALNDLHAKGATPFAALATAMLPPAKDWILIDQLSHLLAGAGKQLNADQATLVGGHSSEGRELGLGLTVTGTVPSTRILRKTGLAPGDLLILTKPLGTGVLFAADMDLKLSATWLAAVVNGMLVSNAAAAAVFVRAGVRACTDISGFGLLGHLREMLVHGDAGLELWPDSIPTYPGTRQLLAEAVSSSMVPANAYNLSLLGPGPWDLTPERTLLLDPQTAGGLLAGVSEETASSVLEELRTAGYPEAAIIGRVMAKGTGPHVVLGKP